MTNPRPLTVLLLPLLLSLNVATIHAINSFTGIGDLPGGSFGSRPYDMSTDGKVVVGVGSVGQRPGNNAPLTVEAFRWTQKDEMIGLGDLDGGFSFSGANGVSGNGKVVVGQGASEGGFLAFRWTSDEGLVSLGDFPGGSVSSNARSVSYTGSVIVGHGSSSSGREAFRWTSDDGMVGLGDLAGGIFSSNASSVSGDGLVVVGTSNSGSGEEAFRWTSDTGMIGLGDLAGGIFKSSAHDVSLEGSVVVGLGNGVNGFEAFRWTDSSGMVGLGSLSSGRSRFSEAWGVSINGSIIVGRAGRSSRVEEEMAFVWDSVNGMRNLQDVLVNDLGLGSSLAGWSLKSATAISDDGRVISGYGINPSGHLEAWVASIPILVPEPSSLVLFALTFVGVAGLGRKFNQH